MPKHFGHISNSEINIANAIGNGLGLATILFIRFGFRTWDTIGRWHTILSYLFDSLILSVELNWERTYDTEVGAL